MVTEPTENPKTRLSHLHAPIDPLDIRLNFNCLLYLFTELLASYNELIGVLKEHGDLSEEEVTRIYKVTAKQEALTQVYEPVFRRFMEYYVNLKTELTGEVPQVVRVGGDSDSPAENSATGTSSTGVTATTTVVQEEVKNS